ncbi:MAG: HemK family protein methyltransferase, partial [Chloroflexi bacterium]|nr:HemK family protein methyltransferase [Chloroflexota bacterium]
MAILRSVIQDTHQKLEAAGIPDARLEAEVLVMNVMRMPRQSIFSAQETEVSGQQQTALDAFLERRLDREPLAYILGQREFYGINVILTPAVLIPRPETEGLVEHALFMAMMGMESTELIIADVGTGSGAIAVNLAIHLPAAKIYAVDVDDAVLDVAA